MDPIKQAIIDKIMDSIKDVGEQISTDKKLTLEDKLHQTDVLLDTMKFLKNYDENVKVLNDYHINNKWKER